MFKLIAPFLLILFFSCSTTDQPTGKTAAEVLYKEAKELMADSRFILATERLNTLRSQYPYSFYATHAELLQADILFEQENFVEAAGAYVIFKDFHPKHKNLDYVVSRIAESFYKQLPPTFDRDLAPAFEAIRYYNELLRLFPGSEYSKTARDKVEECKNLIRKKERYIADFYFKTGDYSPARYRYQHILDKFEDQPLREHAMKRSLRASLILKDKDRCINDYSNYTKEEVSTQTKQAVESSYKSCLKLIK